ncbi:hypothetical protein ACQVP2_08035 [Methylobacterium aquaticum]|uniref:hypothetical protein n=1 Tax=Methylobacterium aquaticum TaxID=270351 RepID=UPI003D177D9E
MSVARGDFARNLAGISEAINLESLAQGAMGTTLPPGVFVLRRGILVAGLIALESFVRERVSEVLRVLERWPRSYENLPEKLRLAARLNALSHLQQFAKMLKRQDEEYELELRSEITKMASGHGTVQQFSKFVAGDFTGNLSDSGMKDLLASLQVSDCWNTFRLFASDVGLGVPSVHEVVKGIVRKRHRSAHSANYSPTPEDIAGLKSDLLCVAMCFDVSVSASMEQALANPDAWAAGTCQWRNAVSLYVAEQSTRGVRLIKFGRPRAICIVNDMAEIKPRVPRAGPGEIAVLIEHDSAGRPLNWDIM